MGYCASEERRHLDFTSVTLEEFQGLVPPSRPRSKPIWLHGALTGGPRTARQFTVYKHCPLPTPENRQFFLLTSLKTSALQVVHGRVFG